MPGNVSISAHIQIVISTLPFPLKLQMRDSSVKFFIYKAKCLNHTFDYHINCFHYPSLQKIYLNLEDLCYTEVI